MTNARCQWRTDKGVRYHLPGCYAGAMSDGQQCHCGTSKTDAITLLERRVEKLEAILLQKVEP